MINPCKGCADRHEACHATCERYKTWSAENDARRAARLKELPQKAYVAERQRQKERRARSLKKK